MPCSDDSSSDSDYNVEQFIKPKRVRRTVNDESADLLGNFDDEKRKEILEGTYKDQTDSEAGSDVEADKSDVDSAEDAVETTATIGGDKETTSSADEDHKEKGANDVTDADHEDETTENGINTNLSKEQLDTLMRGVAKANRFVLYVTNLNFDTTKTDLEAHFSAAGLVKSVRIPKQRRGGFAFVEMADLNGFQSGFRLHNTELQGRHIKVQISEAGKKKSANKKNIIKQKNRKLAEMRNEQKCFTKSGKFYDKNLKKEKAKDAVARQRWRKNSTAAGGGFKPK